KQLAKGTRSAAAALPEAAGAVAQRATQVVEAWNAALSGLEGAAEAPAGLESLLQPAVTMLESLHFELLQMGVLEHAPDEGA
ncbi:MAG: hypothetical protein GWO21_12215, partial [Gammaproteobacteria bacterium]|nr:hypothetical protein [Gammaproteobacteria bacterium]